MGDSYERCPITKLPIGDGDEIVTLVISTNDSPGYNYGLVDWTLVTLPVSHVCESYTGKHAFAKYMGQDNIDSKLFFKSFGELRLIDHYRKLDRVLVFPDDIGQLSQMSWRTTGDLHYFHRIAYVTRHCKNFEDFWKAKNSDYVVQTHPLNQLHIKKEIWDWLVKEGKLLISGLKEGSHTLRGFNALREIYENVKKVRFIDGDGDAYLQYGRLHSQVLELFKDQVAIHTFADYIDWVADRSFEHRDYIYQKMQDFCYFSTACNFYEITVGLNDHISQDNWYGYFDADNEKCRIKFKNQIQNIENIKRKEMAYDYGWGYDDELTYEI